MAFTDKIQTLYKRVERQAFTFISCMCHLVAQELDVNRIHVLYARKFCWMLTSKVGILE